MFGFQTIASEQNKSSKTLDSATEILWYECSNGEAIHYADFEAFYELKGTFVKTVSSDPVGKFDKVDPNSHYSFMYFKIEEPEPRWAVGVLLKDTFIAGGKIYQFDPKIMDRWHYHNEMRVLNNEAVKHIRKERTDDTLNYCGIAKKSE
jgi:hypothetical protein